MATEQDIALHPANRAAHLFLSGTSQETRRADQFFVVFNLYPLDKDDFLATKFAYLNTYRDRLHFLCHTAEGPKFQIQQDVMNQYNRKRVINRKIDYDPMTVRMYDTVDGLGLRFAKLLYEFEFQNARLYTPSGHPAEGPGGANRDNFQESVLTNDNQFKRTHNFGMIAQKFHNHRIIKSIDLYQLQGKLYSRAKMIHPRLTRLDMDQFDYSSSAITNISLAFQYENLLFDEVSVQMEQLPSNVQTAFTKSSGNYEDWVRSESTSNTLPPSDGVNSTIVGGEYDESNRENAIANSYKSGSAVNSQASDANDGFATSGNPHKDNMQKSVTSKYSIPNQPDGNDIHPKTYTTKNSSQSIESQAKAINSSLSSAQLTAERDKLIANGPVSNTLDSKAAYNQEIKIYDQAIKNKKNDEANSKQGIWT
jgi:hypothetical protein